jgi:hypothetical protein
MNGPGFDKILLSDRQNIGKVGVYVNYLFSQNLYLTIHILLLIFH